MKTFVSIYFLILLPVLFLSHEESTAQTRLNDLVEIEHAQKIELIGYGLVAGLDRTGDRALNRRGAVFTVQSIASMLRKFDVNIDTDHLRTRNVAAVMVTATIGPYHSPGSEIDVTVSSLGDASSLNGGVLLQTPLINPQTDQVYAYAQGPVIVGSINNELAGSRVSRNPTLTGTIPSGANVVNNRMYEPDREKPLGLILRQPNFTNASRIVDVVNERFEREIAAARNAGFVSIEWPEGFQSPGDMTFFTSLVMNLEIDVDVPARVVINERTGTVVAGGDVMIGEVLVSHGNIRIQSQVFPFVSQPLPFSRGGQTVESATTEVAFTEESANNIVLEQNTRVVDLANALNELGLSPKDIISIMQAIDKAGALKAKLIVM